MIRGGKDSLLGSQSLDKGLRYIGGFDARMYGSGENSLLMGLRVVITQLVRAIVSARRDCERR